MDRTQPEIRTEADGRKFVGKERVWSADEWRAECAFITAQFDKPRRMSGFLSYCRMQRDSAERQGYFDAAEYIERVIDDLIGA